MGKGKTPRGSRKKTTSSHCTAIEAVEILLRLLNRMTCVDKISLGIIKPKLRAGQRRLKIIKENDKVLLLKMRDTNSLQHVRVYTSDADEVEKALSSYARKKKWGLTT